MGHKNNTEDDAADYIATYKISEKIDMKNTNLKSKHRFSVLRVRMNHYRREIT